MSNRKLIKEKPLGFRIWKREFILMESWHHHNDIEINFLLNGYVRYIHGGRMYEVKPFQFVLFWGGIPHSAVEMAPGTIAYWVTLPLDWLLRWQLPGELKQTILKGEMVGEKNFDELKNYNEQLLHNWLREFQTRDIELLKNIQLELEAKIRRISLGGHESTIYGYRGSSQVPNIFSALLNYVDHNYLTIKNTNEIANFLKMNAKYLMQFFRKYTNINLWEYILRLRVNHAQRLLITTNDKIVDICFAAGFLSLSSFYYIFSKFNSGISPSVYRKQFIQKPKELLG